MYEVFTRNWWRIENGERVSDPAAECTHLCYVDSLKEAVEACKEYNDTHEAGELSHKAEFKAV